MEKEQKLIKKSEKRLRIKPTTVFFLVWVNIIITLFLMNLVSASWTTDLDNDLVAYYEFDNNLLNAVNSGVSYNLTDVANKGTHYTTHGILGNAYNVTYLAGSGFTPLLNSTSYNLLYNNYSINLWFNISASALNYFLRATGDSEYYLENTGGILTSSDLVTSGSLAASYTPNVWQMLTITNNGTYIFLYMNGSLIDKGIKASNWYEISNYTFGTINFKGSFDEIGVWERYLTASEVSQLWNAGSGISYGTIASNVSVNLTAPANQTALSATGANFTTFYNVSSTADYVWKNTTYYIYYNNGTLFNATTKTLSGNYTNDTTFFNSFVIGDYKWNVLAYYGNNTWNNLTWAAGNNTFSIGASLTSLNYTYDVYETSLQTFIGRFTILSGSEISRAQLIYNGTNYTISNISQSGTSLNISKTINIPLNENRFINKTAPFYFRFVYSGNSVQTTATYYQNVSYINLQLCNATYSTTALNFTLTDEVNLTKIDPTVYPVTFKATFFYWLGDGSVKKNYSYQMLNSSVAGSNNYSFCIYPYFPNTYTFKADMDNVFSATDYAENEYYLRNATLTNNTADFDLLLYLLTSADATKFYITIKQGTSFIQNALVTISKYFIGTGDYKTTSIKISDDNGEFPVYLDLDDKYMFSVTKNGVLLGILEKTATCASAPCELEINFPEDYADVFSPYNEAYASNIYSNLTYDSSTKMVTYTFVDITGLANYFRLVVQAVSYNDTMGVVICDKYSYTSAGILTCNMTGYSGDFIATGYISRSPELIDKVLGIFITDALTILGFFGIFLNLAIIITVVFGVAVTSRGNPTAVVFSLGVTVLLLKLGGLFPFSWIVVAPFELIIVWLLTKVKT